MKPFALLSVVSAILAGPLSAEITLPHIFGDHMVLQREKPLPVWGKAAPGSEITVAFGGEKATAKADAEGRWRVDLPALKASAEPREMVVSGDGERKISDVLVGDVWLCSGQSNMEWIVAASANPQEEAAAAKDSAIRHIKVPNQPASGPVEDRDMAWNVCSPETAPHFTACGYYMARELRRELDVPIGLVNSSWGGTRIEPWTPPEAFDLLPSLKDISALVAMADPSSDVYRKAVGAWVDQVAAWSQEAKKALAAGSVVPELPAGSGDHTPLAARPNAQQQPTTLFNGMIHPLLPFAIRGAIWYQGESNHGEGPLYTDKSEALIKGWRERWGYDFPFFYVQIAPFQYGDEDPAVLASFWEAQAAIRRVPKTGMVVTTDIADIKDIHPKNKQEVGRRLALLALKYEYGKADVVADSPRYTGFKVDGGALKLAFSHTGTGLVSRDGAPLSWFEIYDGETGWIPAVAAISGPAEVTLTAEGAKSPVAARFAWNKLAEPNLMSKEGLPVEPFRTGEVPLPDTLAAQVPESAEYEVVYDINLAQLGENPVYTVARPGEIKGKPVKIAYYLELQGAKSPLKHLFVSMDAFTDDLSKIGIPVAGSGAHFQQAVTGLGVRTNVDGIPAAEITEGTIEFWSGNYGQPNSAKVPGASDELYDFGDQPNNPGSAGYGSMQIHAPLGKTTLFAVNNWRAGAKADIGIGNSEGQTRDWTFTGNADSYHVKRLRVLVKTEK